MAVESRTRVASRKWIWEDGKDGRDHGIDSVGSTADIVYRYEPRKCLELDIAGWDGRRCKKAEPMGFLER